MEPIYRTKHTITSSECDPYWRLQPSALLGIMQDAATAQCAGTPADWTALAKQNLFFAVTRQHVQITRIPKYRETITVETWPGQTSRVAYPRNTVAYDEKGNELFRAISLWVLMDIRTRTMVLPGKSGLILPYATRGGELPAPSSIGLAQLTASAHRQVMYSELDLNMHMNNCRYLDWVQDLLPSSFHREHPISDFTICYHAEAHEGERVLLQYELAENGSLLVNGVTEQPDSPSGSAHRVFAVRASYL